MVSLDAEKASDSVNWAFLYKVLERMEFHHDFIHVIRTLHEKPFSRINGDLSQSITTHRGSRQGCPLSPLLFVLYIERLAQWLRQTDNIMVLSIYVDTFKVALYADDVLICISEPDKTLPELMLEKFGDYSGYKINV